MAARCALVSCACALFTASTSALYASLDAAAGAATVTWSGPESTSMRHVPASASRLAGRSGGSTSVSVTVRSQLSVAVSPTHTVRQVPNSARRVVSEMERIRHPPGEHGRLSDVAATQHACRAHA